MRERLCVLACVSAGACVHLKCVQLFLYRKRKIEKIKGITAPGRCQKKKGERKREREREQRETHLGDQCAAAL